MKTVVLILVLMMAVVSCRKDLSEQQVTVTSSDEIVSAGNSPLELVYKDSLYQLTGVAVSQSGRMFTNYPLWRGPHKFDLVEITSKTDCRPYPDKEWNSWKPGDKGSNKWVCVQAVYIDDANIMWVVDPAAPYLGDVVQHAYKLVRINMNTNKVERIYRFNYVCDKQSYINDVRVDTATNFAYLTNSHEGGIVVVDLTTGKMRQVLQGNASVISDPSYKFTIDGKQLRTDFGLPLKFNSDGIALTPDGKFLYYKPVTDDKLYRIETKFLRDFSLPSTRLAAKVKFLGHFTTTDGMIFDKQGNLYLGDIEKSRIVKITPNLSMSTLVSDERLRWPDSYSIANGYLYVSCSQIEKQPEYNLSEHLPKTPYTIYRIKLGL